jgi:hypothetical protein
VHRLFSFFFALFSLYLTFFFLFVKFTLKRVTHYTIFYENSQPSVGSPYGVKYQNIQIPSGIKKAAYWRLYFIARPSLKEIVFTYGALAPQVLLYFLKRKGNTSVF